MAFMFINDVSYKSHVCVRGKSIFIVTFFHTKPYNTMADLNANVTSLSIIVNYVKGRIICQK
jgi:hypothetical protein